MKINMALKSISLNTKIFIVIIYFFISQVMKSNTQVNVFYNVLKYIGLVPLHYEAKIELDLYRNVFFAECNITIHILRQISNISVSSINFGILQIDIIDINNEDEIINVPMYSFINEAQLYIDLTNSSRKVLVPGTYILQMTYVRNIFDNETYFESLYDEKEGIKVLTETGIEVIKAQQILPCWNEPAFQATFNISIKHDKKYIVLSNMFRNVKEDEDDDNMSWTHFVKSPRMFIQNLTIVITTFPNIHSETRNIDYPLPITVTVWSRRNVLDHLVFAKNILFQIVKFLTKHCIQTKIPKIDYIAIGNDQYNEIETWGLILHRREKIFCNETFDLFAYKIKLVNLLVHQVMSIWFHNMPAGFLTYFEMYISGKLRDFDFMEYLFVVQIQQESYRFDIPSYRNFTLDNGSLSVEVNKTIPYYFKSAVLWRMLRNLLDDKAFLSAISNYTLRYSHDESHIEMDQTWLNVHYIFEGAFLRVNLTDYINNWLTKNYYPVLYVEQNSITNNLTISYLSSDYVDKDTEKLPVSVTYYENRFGLNDYLMSVWLLPRNIINLGDYNTINCIIINVQQKGYYRVDYTAYWHKMAHCFHESTNDNVHVLSQAQIVDDAFHSLINGRLGLTAFWLFVSFLSQKANYIAWYPMLKAFEYMACTFPINNFPRMKTHMTRILQLLLYKIGYDKKQNEGDLIDILREETAKWACLLNNIECRKTATLQLAKELEYSAQKSFAWKEEWIYCKGLMSANQTIWSSMFQKLTKTKSDRLLKYLTCSEDPFINSLFLKNILQINNESYFKEEDKRVNLLLLTIAKHAKYDTMFDIILQHLGNKTIQLIGNWQNDRNVILIVTITHIYSESQFHKLSLFKSRYLNETRLYNAVTTKINQRKLECRRQNFNYGKLQL